MEYTRLIQEMETLLSHYKDPFPFRSRIRHTHRVLRWAGRLLSTEAANSEIVFSAVILHDIGYAALQGIADSEHAKLSAQMADSLLHRISCGLSENSIQQILQCIRYHSRKELLVSSDTALPAELIVLMEADLLDETGPLALLWDAMAEGLLPEQSFEKTYQRMAESAPPYVEGNPCHTPTAQTYWLERQALHQRFLASYHRDLGYELDVSWRLPYTKAFQYMQHCMKEHELVPNRFGIIFPFRQRSLHMERVACWAFRLSRGDPRIRPHIVILAAILHDIGYAVNNDGIAHAYESARMAREYLLTTSLCEEDINQICYMIYHHSDKTYLSQSNNEPHFQLLLEADHLDETGAMAIAWDAMASMQVSEDPSYVHSASRIKQYTLKMLQNNPLVTSLGRSFWEDKQQVVQQFYQLLIHDLEEQ